MEDFSFKDRNESAERSADRQIRMRTRSREQARHTHGGPSVYSDLGYRDPDRMLVKAQLVSRIAELLAERRITQTQVKASLGIPQPVLSKLLRGQFRGFSMHKLANCLRQLGQNAQIVVRQALNNDAGAVSVTFK